LSEIIRWSRSWMSIRFACLFYFLSYFWIRFAWIKISWGWLWQTIIPEARYSIAFFITMRNICYCAALCPPWLSFILLITLFDLFRNKIQNSSCRRSESKGWKISANIFWASYLRNVLNFSHLPSPTKLKWSSNRKQPLQCLYHVSSLMSAMVSLPRPIQVIVKQYLITHDQDQPQICPLFRNW